MPLCLAVFQLTVLGVLTNTGVAPFALQASTMAVMYWRFITSTGSASLLGVM